MALGILKKVSPEYVLGKAFLDIKKSGIDGLKPYLTEEAKKKVEVIAGGMSLISTVSKLVGSSNDSKEDSNKAVNFLMEKMSECGKVRSRQMSLLQPYMWEREETNIMV